jgi:MHS family proline/betaine transporter-like MFS transporter
MIYVFGFLSRIITALILNIIADIRGRAYVLQFSIFISSIGLAAMTAVPSYEQIGVFSPILLLICRLLVVAGGGGGHTTSLAFLIEHTSILKRGKIIGYAASAEIFGVFVSLAILMIYKLAVPSPDLNNYWKLLFLLMIPFVLIARKCVFEPLEFITKNHYDVERPLSSFLINFILIELPKNKHLFIPAVFLVLLGNCSFAIAFEYMPNMLAQKFGITALQCNIIILIIFGIIVPLTAYLGAKSDKTGRIKSIRKYALLLTVLWIPFFFSSDNFMLASIIGVVIMFLTCGYFACASALLIESISSSVARCSIHVLICIVPSSIFNGFLPVVLEKLEKIENGYLMIAVFLTIASLLVFVTVCRVAEPLDKCKGIDEYSLDTFQIS